MIKNLKDEIRLAIAWGFPDNESTGYSHQEFIALLRRALKRIEYLENHPEKEPNDNLPNY